MSYGDPEGCEPPDDPDGPPCARTGFDDDGGERATPSPFRPRRSTPLRASRAIWMLERHTRMQYFEGIIMYEVF